MQVSKYNGALKLYIDKPAEQPVQAANPTQNKLECSIVMTALSKFGVPGL